MSGPVTAQAPGPGQEVLADPLASRWSPSVFDSTHVLDRDQIEALLQAARWAPSAGNLQPWGFVVAERGAPAHDALVRQLSRGNAGWVPRASVVLIAAARIADDPADPDGHPSKGEARAAYDLGQAAAHVTLQARAMGLHAHQFSGFDHEALAAELGVPAHYRILSGIAVGVRGDAAEVPAGDAERDRKPRRRRPLAEIAFAPTWSIPWQLE